MSICLQVVVQLHFLIVIYLMGTGAVVEGIDIETFANSVGKIRP
jgi:hypothetical protein